MAKKVLQEHAPAVLDAKGYRMMQSRGQVAFARVAKTGVVDLDGINMILHEGDYLMRQHGDLTPVSVDIVERYWFTARGAEMVCRKCGCTQEDACPGGCSWAAENLCSSCAPGKPSKRRR
jgi:hypothetical protein